jgi:hypothetical protein
MRRRLCFVFKRSVQTSGIHNIRKQTESMMHLAFSIVQCDEVRLLRHALKVGQNMTKQNCQLIQYRLCGS